MWVGNRSITVCYSCGLWWHAVQMAQARGQFWDACQGTQALPAGDVQAASQSSSAELQGMHQGRSPALDVQGPGLCLGLTCCSRLREVHQGGPGPRTALPHTRGCRHLHSECLWPWCRSTGQESLGLPSSWEMWGFPWSKPSAAGWLRTILLGTSQRGEAADQQLKTSQA